MINRYSLLKLIEDLLTKNASNVFGLKGFLILHCSSTKPQDDQVRRDIKIILEEMHTDGDLMFDQTEFNSVFKNYKNSTPVSDDLLIRTTPKYDETQRKKNIEKAKIDREERLFDAQKQNIESTITTNKFIKCSTILTVIFIFINLIFSELTYINSFKPIVVTIPQLNKTIEKPIDTTAKVSPKNAYIKLKKH